MKKGLGLLLALLMVFTLFGSASAELEPMTDEEITLVFGAWDMCDQYAPVLELSIAAFTEAYPNITVERMYLDTGTLNSDLLNMAAAGTLPDVYITFDMPGAVQSGWAADVTDFLENDPDADAIMDSYLELSQIAGRNYAIPAYTYPYVTIVNTTMIEKYNLEIPDADWTWDEYEELGNALAHYEDYNFGFGGHSLYRWYLAIMDGQSSYGWDGTSYNFSDDWVESLLIQADYRDSHTWEGFDSDEDKIAAVGSADVWIPGAGIIGLFTDYNWASDSFLKFYSVKTSQNFVIYPQPLGETDNAMAAVDFCVISPSCEYQREAYELSKWIVWGEQACMDRVNYYEEAGVASIRNLPVITTDSVWEAFSAHSGDNIKLFDSIRNYIPEASYIAPGYDELQTWLDDNEIIDGIMTGAIDGYAILDELNSVAAEKVEEYFSNLIID